jgi:hypothetical protein
MKWDLFLTFRRFPAACCRELQYERALEEAARRRNKQNLVLGSVVIVILLFVISLLSPSYNTLC